MTATPAPEGFKFSKGHDPAALNAALAIKDRNQRQEAVNKLTLKGGRKLVSPQAGVMVTGDPPVTGSPENKSQRTAAELAELGLRYLLRDVRLDELATHPDAIRGAQMLADFGIPRMVYGEGPDGLFRMNGERVGADRVGRLSQAWIPTGWGEPFTFKSYRRLGAYGVTEAEWKALQDGNIPRRQEMSASTVPISTGRDIASLAHQDPPISIGDCVTRILLAHNAPFSSRAPLTTNEQAFVSPGGVWELQCANGIAALPAGQVGWRLKFRDNRRARPEELWPMAVRGELNESFLRLAGWIVDRVGQYLPMAYAEGCPLHSDDPSGHAISAGVWITICKAWFADGPVPSLSIQRLHEEIDLMGWHQTDGRAWAGIHTRRSLTAGLRIGEQHALAYLRQQNATSPQPLGATSFIGVDGKLIELEGT
jgi:hypothetical protein